LAPKRGKHFDQFLPGERKTEDYRQPDAGCLGDRVFDKKSAIRTAAFEKRFAGIDLALVF
jgi:hypothetical protein